MREPVEDLLRRVQSDYSQLYFEHKKLREALEQADPRPVEQSGQPRAETATTVDRLDPQPVRQSPAKDPDEFARLALAAAHRAARELRESARRDCELMLKKAHARVLKLERDFERLKNANAELEELDAMMHEIREQMRSALQAILPMPADAASVANPARAQTDLVDGHPRTANGEVDAPGDADPAGAYLAGNEH